MLPVYYNNNDATTMILLPVVRPHETFLLIITNNATHNTNPQYHAHSLVTASIEKLIPVLISVLQRNPRNSKMLGAGGRLLRRLSLSTNSLHAACVKAGSVSVMVEAFQMDKVSLWNALLLLITTLHVSPYASPRLISITNFLHHTTTTTTH